MKAEISHHGFKDEKRYSGVYLQQGTMITDRDWNALCDRMKQRLDNANRFISASGIPKSSGLLTAFTESDPVNHIWSANFAGKGGWVAADGVIAEASPADISKDFSYTNQRDLPGLSLLPEKAFLCADIWDQVVTAFDERDLLDPGLHGAHTCFVTRTLVQIKRYKDEHDKETLCGLKLDPAKMPSKGTGRFQIALRQSSAGEDNCDPCAETVDVEQNVGNYLFRLEVHDVTYDVDGVPQSATLKWSSENGAVQYDRPNDFDHSTLDPDYAYEFFNDSLELLAGPPPEGYGTSSPRGELRHANLSGVSNSFDRIRQWDGYCKLDVKNGTFVVKSGTVLDGWDKGVNLASGLPADAHGRVGKNGQAFVINLEKLQLEITLTGADEDGNAIAVLAGDYWLALARTRAEEAERVRALSEMPIGIQHHYCVIGLCETDGKSFKEIKPADKRRLHFPALTCLQAGDIGFQQDCDSSLFKGENPQNVDEALKLLCDIQAADIGYDNKNCAYAKSQKATNVQAALDAFCKRLQHPYLVLRMSQGTGQESPPGALLPCPVSVIVEDQDGKPVKGVPVTFSVKPSDKDQVFKDAASANPAANQKEVEVKTDEEGQASAAWWVDGKPGCHGLKAELAKVPQERAAPVWFSAHVDWIEAGEVVFNPACQFLKDQKADTVEKALNELCGALPGKRQLPKLAGISWENDQPLTLTDFLKTGLAITFTEKMETKLISSNNLVVTIEAPDEEAAQLETSAFKPLVVCGRVTALSQTKIQFKPSWNEGAALQWLSKKIEQARPWKPDWTGLRCRVRLLGRFVFNAKAELMTDGFVPGALLPEGTIALDFKNAGAGSPSDFESWFYLVPGRITIDINKATENELTTLPGIDARTAKEIIDGRPWTSVDDLVGRTRINATQMASLKPLIRT